MLLIQTLLCSVVFYEQYFLQETWSWPDFSVLLSGDCSPEISCCSDNYWTINRNPLVNICNARSCVVYFGRSRRPKVVQVWKFRMPSQPSNLKFKLATMPKSSLRICSFSFSCKVWNLLVVTAEFLSMQSIASHWCSACRNIIHNLEQVSAS